VLAYAKHEGVVDDQAAALGLSDVEIMALGVRCRVASEEGVRWVLAGVQEWHCEGKSVWVIFDAVHETALAGIHFQNAFAFITRQERLYYVALSTGDPRRLGERDLPRYIA
jgi:hypothetical protein